MIKWGFKSLFASGKSRQIPGRTVEDICIDIFDQVCHYWSTLVSKPLTLHTPFLWTSLIESSMAKKMVSQTSCRLKVIVGCQHKVLMSRLLCANWIACKFWFLISSGFYMNGNYEAKLHLSRYQKWVVFVQCRDFCSRKACVIEGLLCHSSMKL